ncbi:MAG: hypothetical protein AAFY71_16320 [Bacteroidota bacterium]
MSNFSNIGFPIATEEQLYELAERAYQQSMPYPSEKGTYYCYADPSGAELWIQISQENELIGINPHFRGSSSRRVGITTSLDRPPSIMDGGFHAWSEPQDPEKPDTGLYPFVFDSPDYRLVDLKDVGVESHIQLTGFTFELGVYQDEEAYMAQQEGKIKYSAESFIPMGLWGSGEEGQGPEATAMLAGTIKEAELKTNMLTGERFYSMLVETLGGEIDLVADPNIFEIEPLVGGIAMGSFWLSGKI